MPFFRWRTLGLPQRAAEYLRLHAAGKGKSTLPVLYLFHSSGDTEAARVNVRRANLILDNLIAASRAKPMIGPIVDLKAGSTA